MKFVTKARLGKDQAFYLKRIAETRRTSVSAVIDDALRPFAEGQKKAPAFPSMTAVYTGFSVDENLLKKTKELAANNNISWDDLVRYAVEDLISSLSVKS